MGILVDQNLDMPQQCTFAAQKAKPVLGCTKRDTASRLREVISPLFSALERPQNKKGVYLLEQVQSKPQRRLEHL